MLRRAGVFGIPREPASLKPKETDSGKLLDAKWKHWVRRESFKRLVIREFAHSIKLTHTGWQLTVSFIISRHPFRTIRAP